MSDQQDAAQSGDPMSTDSSTPLDKGKGKAVNPAQDVSMGEDEDSSSDESAGEAELVGEAFNVSDGAYC